MLQEAREGMIDLVEDDPGIVARMLIYLYNPGLYESTCNSSDYYGRTFASEMERRVNFMKPDECEGFSDRATIHAQLHGLSKKYDIPDLALASSERFVEHVKRTHDYESWHENSECLVDLIDAIKVVYGLEQDSDRILQEAVVYLARIFAKKVTMYELHEDLDMEENIRSFRDLLSSASDFAWDLVTLDFEKARFACDWCEHEFTSSQVLDTAMCECAHRGLCGLCVNISKLACPVCGTDACLSFDQMEAG